MMFSGPRRLFAVIVLIAGMLSGCAATGGPSSSNPVPSMTLNIENDTTIAVTLVVNGKVIESVPAGRYEAPIKAELPGLPWTVETRSPSGRVLSSMTVHAGDVWYTANAAKGDAVRVDLSCGRLDVWSGPPLAGPPPGPGQSGDCA
jgi:hypothetical protein